MIARQKFFYRAMLLINVVIAIKLTLGFDLHLHHNENFLFLYFAAALGYVVLFIESVTGKTIQ